MSEDVAELVAFYRAQLDKDEWWAREASRLRGQRGHPAGDHWQWVETDTDQVLLLDPSQYEYVGDEYEARQVSLRSREEYPTATVGDLPNFAIHSAEEVPSTVAGHIVRHDPARTLARVKAGRRLIERYDRAPKLDGYAQACLDAIRDAAAVYAGESGYREEWAP